VRRVFRLIFVSLAVVGFAATLIADSPPDTVRTIFQVDGMHCNGCSSAITATLEKMNGVIEVLADHKNGVAEAVHKPRKVEAEELKTEIEKLGYTVTGMETEAVEL